MDDNEWDPDSYDDDHAFVFERGGDVVDLLDPQPGERVLDLGCGTGHLTKEIADRGAEVVGIDADQEMIDRARVEYPELTFRRADARDFTLETPVDAVFSNAVLHWIPGRDHGAVLERVADVLVDGGRFVGEFGGAGNVSAIVDALEAELAARGVDFEHPYYFPRIGEYAPRLAAAGFEVRFTRLFDRPTPLEGGLRNWIGMFGDAFFTEVSEAERETILGAVEDRLRDELYDGDGWTADYRRLRFSAVRDPVGSTQSIV